MKKILLLMLALTLSGLILLGMGRFYISYNLHHYAGYYVQQLPRKEGTNPELVIILTHLDSVERPEGKGLAYNLRGNGGVELKNQLYLSYMTDSFNLYPLAGGENYLFDVNDGSFLYYVKNLNFEETDRSESKAQMAKDLVDKMISPILDIQPKPKINLQKLFNEKYYDQFN